VDEASQCSEPELLMPLFYKTISKMILIGDPMQLPATVKSRKANDMRFGRSLFERFFEHFGGYEDESNPVLMLDEQYRMHPDICKFPAEKFYAGRLKSHESIAARMAKFPLRAYSVINVRDTSLDTLDPKNVINRAEARFVINVCHVICTILKHSTATIGIITPYQGQKKLLQNLIDKENLSIQPTVNTIDGFQGQEKDIIILSCVRANENGHAGGIGFMGSMQRMNVALTRAKHSFIACVSRPALEHNDLWKSFIDDAVKRHCIFSLPASACVDTIAKMLKKAEEQKIPAKK